MGASGITFLDPVGLFDAGLAWENEVLSSAEIPEFVLFSIMLKPDAHPYFLLE